MVNHCELWLIIVVDNTTPINHCRGGNEAINVTMNIVNHK
jgi:hypothetical protein